MRCPHLDHAELGDRKWCWAAGCWREWSNTHADWLPSAPPPAEARFFNYAKHILAAYAAGREVQ